MHSLVRPHLSLAVFSITRIQKHSLASNPQQLLSPYFCIFVMGRISLPVLVLASLSLVRAITSPSPDLDTNGGSQGSQCPAVWSQISTELTPVFLGPDGQCTDLARAAIRFAFHDSGKYGYFGTNHEMRPAY